MGTGSVVKGQIGLFNRLGACFSNPRSMSVIIMLALFVLGAIVIIVTPIRPPAELGFTPELVKKFSVMDSRPLRLAHKVIFFGTFFSYLLLLINIPSRQKFTRHRLLGRRGLLRNWFGAFLLLTAISIFVFYYFLGGPTIYIGTAKLSRDTSAILGLVLLANMCASLVAILRCKIIITYKHFAIAAGGVLALYLMFLYLPALLSPPWLQYPLDKHDLFSIENHYSAITGLSILLYHGKHLFSETQQSYGILFATLSAALQRFFGQWDFGTYIRFVQILQIFFLILVVTTFRLWYRRRVVTIALCILFIVPWIYPGHAAIFYPNQSALRFMNFPLGVLALLLVRRYTLKHMPLLLGSVAGICLLINLETAIVILFGFFVFVAVTCKPPYSRNMLRSVLLGCVGIVISLATAALFFRSMFGYWPLPASLKQIFGPIMSAGNGYSGFGFQLNILALIIATHCVYVLNRSAIARRAGPLSNTLGVRTAIASMVILWFAYFANRPASWDLWSFYYLYAFFLGDFTHRYFFRLRTRSIEYLLPSPRTAIFLVVIVPIVLFTNIELARYMVQYVKTGIYQYVVSKGGHSNTEILSGIRIHSALSRALRRKADELKDAYQGKGSVIYFTGNTFFMPLLTGHTNSLGKLNPFWSTTTPKEFHRFISEILMKKPRILYFDNPESALAKHFPYAMEFWARFRKRLAGAYRISRTTAYWLVMTRKDELIEERKF